VNRRRKPLFEPGYIPSPGALLEWRDARHFDGRQDAECVLCGQPTPMRSHHGEPAHKACAEAWIAANPVEARLGRFASDLQSKRQHHDDHA
jgi:hypothetical protein